MKRLLIALAAIFLCAPATASIRGYQFAPSYRPEAPKVPAPVTGSTAGIRTVAVLSGIGQRFELEIRGVAGKRSGTLDITAWQIDDRVEAAVRLALKDRFRFARMAYDRRALAPLKADLAHAGAFATFLKGLPAQGIDAFVVVRPAAAGGLALQSVAQRDTILWTDYFVEVIDARSLAVIASASARVQPPGATKANFPGLVVGREYTLDPSLQLSAAQAEKLHHFTNEMLDVTLTETLQAMGMGGR